jgi:hypothetical protein
MDEDTKVLGSCERECERLARLAVGGSGSRDQLEIGVDPVGGTYDAVYARGADFAAESEDAYTCCG